ncbi:MAG: hypothetical protein ABI925_04840 [Verrucomicrobiota bacterium]
MILFTYARFFCLVGLLSLASARAGQVDLQESIRSLVEAEKGYARLGAEKGFRAASLVNFAADAVIFAPGIVNGKKFWQESKEDPVISWGPSFASVARSGDLGYTTGPAEFRKARGDEQPEGFGHFVSIWRKDSEGVWKVVFDVGVSHPKPPESKNEGMGYVPTATLSHPESAAADLEKARGELGESLTKGEGPAILACASDDIRIYRRGAIPLVGKTAAQKMLGTENWKTSRSRSGGGMSKTNDLAYDYGEYTSDHDGATERGIYFCIWRLASDNGWKLVVDLQKKAPAESK